MPSTTHKIPRHELVRRRMWRGLCPHYMQVDLIKKQFSQFPEYLQQRASVKLLSPVGLLLRLLNKL
jgi:hypothetical protein